MTVEISDDSDQEQQAHTVVEVVRVTNNAMTPIPHVNSDDSDGTETEDEKVIVSMCCQCGERVPIQMKENGSCHGKCLFCKKNEEHRIRGVTDVTTMYRQGPWQMDHVMEHADTAVPE